MKFKKWVEIIVWLSLGLTMLVGVSECESNKLFFTKSLISLVIMYIDYKLLKKYSRILEK